MYGKLPGKAPGWAGDRPPHLGPTGVHRLAAGRLPLPLVARLPGHRHARAAPLAARLRLLRRVRGQGDDRALARGSRAWPCRSRAASRSPPLSGSGSRARSGSSTPTAGPPSEPMLRRVDIGLELVGWSLAVFFVILLFAGPRVVAEDKPEAPADQARRRGRRPAAPPPTAEAVFTDNCGSCHTLSAAGTSGTVGPNLDDTSLDASAIEDIVRDGRGGMPAFGGQALRRRDQRRGGVRRRQLDERRPGHRRRDARLRVHGQGPLPRAQEIAT